MEEKKEDPLCVYCDEPCDVILWNGLYGDEDVSLYLCSRCFRQLNRKDTPSLQALRVVSEVSRTQLATGEQSCFDRPSLSALSVVLDEDNGDEVEKAQMVMTTTIRYIPGRERAVRYDSTSGLVVIDTNMALWYYLSLDDINSSVESTDPSEFNVPLSQLTQQQFLDRRERLGMGGGFGESQMEAFDVDAGEHFIHATDWVIEQLCNDDWHGSDEDEGDE